MVDTPCIFVGGMESGLTADASCLGQEWIKRVAEAMPEGTRLVQRVLKLGGCDGIGEGGYSWLRVKNGGGGRGRARARRPGRDSPHRSKLPESSLK